MEELLSNWSVQTKPSNFNEKAFIILDKTGVLRADVWIKITSHDQYGEV